MKIYTKTGDDGTTGLIGGSRVKKYDIRLEAYGTIDELNAYIGLLRSFSEIKNEQVEHLIKIQNKLFVIGGALATDKNKGELSEKLICSNEDVFFLENLIDNYSENLPELTHFVLPGGHPVIAYCHIARTICRRAERRIVELADEQIIQKSLIQFINRLSDFIFVLSRQITHDLNVNEIPWIP